MAASTGKATGLSKADYLKRYLSGDGDSKKSKEKKVKKKRSLQPGKGMKIVDDDVDWKQMMTTNEEKEKENDDEEDEAPVVAEFVDERPAEVRRLEAFRTSNKWRIMGDDSGSQDSQGFSYEENNQERGGSGSRHDSPDVSPRRPARHDSPDASPQRKRRNDSPDQSPQRKPRQDSPDPSPPRRTRHDSPDVSPPRRMRHDSPDASPPRKARHDSSSPSPPRKAAKSSSPRSTNRGKDVSSQSKKAKGSSRDQPKGHSRDRDLSPPRRRPVKGGGSDSDQSPPRRRPAAGRGADSDLSPPRKKRQAGGGSDSDLSPPRRRGQGGGGSDSDLSPPRRPTSPRSQAPQMLSGGAAGLVSRETLRKEQEEIKRKQKLNKPLEEESRNAQTIFRDKSGKMRDLDSERQEQSRKAGEKAEKDAKYAQWGKGMAQSQMQQQNVEDALKEAQKPLARRRDDEELDRMLREQERDGDPMAAMLRKKKAKDNQLKGIKEKPRYKGPQPPPNRFNIMPGYRWDGLDRSNGFEQKRYSRIADKQAVQDMAYKWSVEDM